MNIDLEKLDGSLSKFRALAIAAGLYHLSLDQVKELSDDRFNAITELLHLPVSSVSRFVDVVWNFYPDHEGALTLSESRLSIDFGNFKHVPQPIITELKVAMRYVLELPAKEVNPRARRTTKLTPQSVLPMAKTWLSFMEHVCAEISAEYGVGFLLKEYNSLSRFKLKTYVRHSKTYSQAESTMRQLERVFAWFKAKRIQDALFDETPALPQLSQLELVTIRKKEDTREKVLDDDVFEKAVTISGQIISEFLQKLQLPVVDSSTLKYAAYVRFPIPQEASYPLTEEELAWYVSCRAGMKRGDWSLKKEIVDGRTRNIPSKALHDYTKIVHEAAMYLIGQFTGMRPSELLELRSDHDLLDSFGVPCIRSTIHKKREKSQRLFDDKWVAIPAVQDALTALKHLTPIRNNPYVFSKSETVPEGQMPKPLSKGASYVIKGYFEKILSSEEVSRTDFYSYMMRHTLAYQMFVADLGLPFISHQLKHFGHLSQGVAKGDNRSFSADTLGYGEIGDMLAGDVKKDKRNLRHKAEVTAVKATYDPDGAYAGVNAYKHKERLKKVFKGYQAEGYTKEAVFEAMAEQGIATINVGMGMCYGGRQEDFDETLPCIGSLRCNPNRCPRAVVTKAHAPKWREVYEQNIKIVEMGETADNYAQALAATTEAKGVLEYLGEV